MIGRVKMKKRQLSVGSQVFWSDMVCGITWIAAGICSCIDAKWAHWAGLICSAMAVLILLAVFRYEKQKYDEMAIEHMTQARAEAFRWVYMVLLCSMLVCTILPSFSEKAVHILLENISGLLYVLIGMLNLKVGLAFKRLEEE